MKSFRVAADFVLLNWIVAFAENESNCNKLWRKETMYQQFMENTDESLIPKIFTERGRNCQILI